MSLQAFLESPHLPPSEVITVAHIRRFVPCTSNIDPYLRKLIRERKESLGEDTVMQVAAPILSLSPNARHLFHVSRFYSFSPENFRFLLFVLFLELEEFLQDNVWDTIDTPLVEMKIEDVCQLVK